MDYQHYKRIWEIRHMKNNLTRSEIVDMIKFDWENMRTIPDSSSYKMKFVKEKQLLYEELGLQEQYEAWKQEEERLQNLYPAIHLDKERK